MIADTFTKSLTSLSPQDQNLVKQSAFDFQLNPANPGAQFHRLDKVRDKNLWSFRVNRDLRMIVYKNSGDLILCYADHHDKAYSWAENRQLEPNPDTGAMQLVEVHERVEEVVKRIVREIEEEPPLFKKYAADYLLALGVPRRWLDAVYYVGETGFLELIDHLPQEASENLLKLANHHPVPRPVVMLGQDPFLHPDAQRRFRVIDKDQQLLRQALNAPWEQWLVFLHPSQQDLVEKDFTGSAKVSGGAGTGKTVVALHRAAHLARENPGARILLTTYSTTLATRLNYNLELLLPEAGSERRAITVTPLHRLTKNLWEARTGRTFALLTDKGLTQRLEHLNREVGSEEFSLAFLTAEWTQVVDPNGIGNWEDYKSVTRTGRGTPLGIRQRLQAWNIFDALQQDLRTEGFMSFERLCFETAKLLEAEPGVFFDHVIADEVQDFGPAELTLLRALVRLTKNDLFLAGDVGQRIYKVGSSYAAAGIDVRGRAAVLRLNYRTTEQIRRYADSILPEELADVDGNSETRHTISLLSGPKPEVRGFGSAEEEIRYLAEQLQTWLTNGYRACDIAIFARTHQILKQRAQVVLDLCGLRGAYLNDEDPPSPSDVSLGTMHRAKGLEFRIVVVMGCEADQLPLAAALGSVDDEAARRDFTERERHLLYVANTRAREHLTLTYAGAPSAFLRSASTELASPQQER